MKEKRIAVCFCGQLRYGNNATANLSNFFGSLFDNIDFFVHTWDQNSHRNVLNLSTSVRPATPVSDSDLNDFKNFYNPKGWQVENQQQYYQNILDEHGATGTLINVYYSFYQAVKLKQQYEQQHNFNYDIVVKLRPDIIFPKDRTFLQDLTEYNSDSNAVYSLRHDDIYQIGSSRTMDIVADFYNSGLLQGSLDWPMNKFIVWLQQNQIKFNGLNDYRSTIIRPESSYFCSLNNYDEICLINSQLYNKITFSNYEMNVYYENFNNTNASNDMISIFNRLLGEDETNKLKLTLGKTP